MSDVLAFIYAFYLAVVSPVKRRAKEAQMHNFRDATPRTFLSWHTQPRVVDLLMMGCRLTISPNAILSSPVRNRLTLCPAPIQDRQFFRMLREGAGSTKVRLRVGTRTTTTRGCCQRNPTNGKKYGPESRLTSILDSVLSQVEALQANMAVPGWYLI
jgi:hypothetical protein